MPTCDIPVQVYICAYPTGCSSLSQRIGLRGDLLRLRHPPVGTGQAERSTHGSMTATRQLIHWCCEPATTYSNHLKRDWVLNSGPEPKLHWLVCVLKQPFWTCQNILNITTCYLLMQKEFAKCAPPVVVMQKTKIKTDLTKMLHCMPDPKCENKR